VLAGGLAGDLEFCLLEDLRRDRAGAHSIKSITQPEAPIISLHIESFQSVLVPQSPSICVHHAYKISRVATRTREADGRAWDATHMSRSVLARAYSQKRSEAKRAANPATASATDAPYPWAVVIRQSERSLGQNRQSHGFVMTSQIRLPTTTGVAK
jgi:hypothetical protein